MEAGLPDGGELVSEILQSLTQNQGCSIASVQIRKKSIIFVVSSFRYNRVGIVYGKEGDNNGIARGFITLSHIEQGAVEKVACFCLHAFNGEGAGRSQGDQ